MKTLEQIGVSPAPWKQGEWIPYCEDNIIRCDYNRKDGTPSTRIVANCNAAFSPEQARIDARLIAAAPDLYKALRECLSALNSVGGMGWDGNYASMAKRNAVKAIEKAGGEA